MYHNRAVFKELCLVVTKIFMSFHHEYFMKRPIFNKLKILNACHEYHKFKIYYVKYNKPLYETCLSF